MELWQYCLLGTARLLYMFRTLSASIIRSTENCSSSHWCACFGRFLRPSSRVLKTVVAATATTVFSTPDDGRRKRPKHVE